MTLTQPELRSLAEELADVLEERGLVCRAGSAPARVLNAREVAEQLGRDRGWVYAHRKELGAFLMGSGPKARLGFDQLSIEAWKREQTLLATAPPAAAARPARRRGSRSSSPDLIPYEETP